MRSCNSWPNESRPTNDFVTLSLSSKFRSHRQERFCAESLLIGREHVKGDHWSYSSGSVVSSQWSVGQWSVGQWSVGQWVSGQWSVVSGSVVMARRTVFDL